VPRRPERWRDRLWDFTRAQLEASADLPIFEGLDEGPAPMNRSAAINRAAADAGDWKLAVVLDADTLIPASQLQQGIEFARGGELVLPHDHFRSLSKNATREVLAGDLDPAEAPVRWVKNETKSSCLCVGRVLWEEVGGFDEDFVGWGYEDAAFFAACRALSGVARIPGPVHHLWHPRSAEKDTQSPQYIANCERAGRYKEARGAEEMRELLEALR
jgi:hypothetical protein